MNTETTNKVIDLSPPQEWLYKCDCPQCRVGAHYNKDIAESYRKRGELNKEVARLRELLARAIEIADLSLNDENYASYSKECELIDRLTDLKAELDRLAPEETVTEKDTEVSKEPILAWRELGADEVICEGDEIQWPYKDWQTAKSSIGYKVGYWDGLVKARTRRLLPKAQEKMPLEKELDYLTREASRASDIHNHVLIVDCLRYLRDEIQKLKEAR